jgi:tetratricopeptide (TPR) repeat protein
VRLRQHAAECKECAERVAGDQAVAVSLERLAGATRIDLSPDAAEALYQRARRNRYIGRGARRPLGVRLARSRWVRAGAAVGLAVAATLVITIGIHSYTPAAEKPLGALDRLAHARAGVKHLDNLKALAPLARAAVGEELARLEPSTDQVADLLLVAYIADRPREERQVRDVHFLLEGIWSRRHENAQVAQAMPAWPMMASTVLAQTSVPSPYAGDYDRTSPLSVARMQMLDGHYNAALELLPKDGSAAVLRAWCMEATGQTFDAKGILYEASKRPDGAAARVIWADLALASNNVGEAVEQYKTLAADQDRYWFTAGYVYRYEYRDPRGTGERMAKVRDPQFADYVSKEFGMELAAAKAPELETETLFEEDFSSFPLGAPPADWAMVRTRGGEFRIVGVPGGKALEQDEINHRSGAEFLTGDESWSDYTFKVDVKVLSAQDDFAITAVACRQSGHKGYMLEWSPRRLRIVKQFASGQPGAGNAERLLLEPEQGEIRLDEPPASGWWYTLKVRVQHVGSGMNVAGKVWRTDTPEPMEWQVAWTDTGQMGDGTFPDGAAGVQISGAKALITNFIVKKNAPSTEVQPANGR